MLKTLSSIFRVFKSPNRRNFNVQMYCDVFLKNKSACHFVIFLIADMHRLYEKRKQKTKQNDLKYSKFILNVQGLPTMFNKG